MPRIIGVNIPDNKKLGTALTYIYGIGAYSSKKIISDLNLDPNKKAKDLTAAEVNRIKEHLDKSFKIEGDLRRFIQSNVKRLKDIQSYKGIRHMRRLPVRGQRTRTNTRTVRGNVRKTLTSGRKKSASPT